MPIDDKMIVVSVRLPEQLLAAMQEKASRRGMTTSALMRESMELYNYEYRRRDIEPPEQPTLEGLEKSLHRQLDALDGLRRQTDLREEAIRRNLAALEKDRQEAAKKAAERVRREMRQVVEQVDIEAG